MNEILLGDTLGELKRLPCDRFDVGVTSPPYNKLEKHKGWLVKNVVYDTYADVVPEREYQENQLQVLNELHRVTKPGGSFFYNHKVRWERGRLIHPLEWVSRTNWVLRQEIIWNRGIAANIRGWRFWQLDERIYWLIKPKGHDLIGDELQSRHALLSSIWEIRPEAGADHPSPFPLELPARCIFSILNEAEGYVIDPYCGSGTTLVAARLLGKDYLGIDVSPAYVEVAAQRLRLCESERPRLDTELARHRVNKTFRQRKEEGAWVGRHRRENANDSAPLPGCYPDILQDRQLVLMDRQVEGKRNGR
jgi:site-specific DNA-methyltransferase (adenine-specific)